MDHLTARPRVWLEIDLRGLRQNYDRIGQAVAPCEVIPVLKANAYGLGVRPIADALAKAGARRFGVADLKEAISLTEAGYQVQILGAVMPDEIPTAVAADVILPICDPAIGRAVSRAALAQGRPARCHILIDSGMGRLGLPWSNAVPGILQIAEQPGLDVEGIYSHFPLANHPDNEFTRNQIRKFKRLLGRLTARGLSFRLVHLANSDGINNFPEAALAPFNAVRSGINLYGSYDLTGGRAYQLHSVLTLKSRLAQVRRLPAGMSIGYGHTYRLPRASLVGTVSAGYGDGVPTALSNRGYVLIRDRPCPIIGQVSMDYCTVSLATAPMARCGDEAVFIGGGHGDFAITVQDWAELKGSNTYEIICSFGSRVTRVYR